MKEKLLRWKDRFWACHWLREILSAACLFCVLFVLDWGLRWMYKFAGVSGVRSYYSGVPWVFSAAWALLLTSLVRLLPRRGRKIATGIVGGLACALFLTHTLLYQAKGAFFSFSSLIFAGDGFKFIDASYFQVRKMVWIFFFCGIAGSVLSSKLTPPGGRKLYDRLATLAAAALCVAAVNWNVRANLTASIMEIHFDMYQESLLYEDFTAPNECLLLAGMYQYTFRDFCLTYGVYDRLSRTFSGEVDGTFEALDAWYANKEPDPDNAWTGRFKGKNLILVQLEAIDDWLVTEQFMPNLYRIRQESLDFTQTFTPLYLYAGTFNTEMIVNTGLVSPFTGSTPSMYSRNAYPDSLAHLMTEAGYSANSFHRSSGSVYNRAVVHENWGYAHYYSGEEMGIEDLDFDTELMRAYDTMTAEEPFLTFIITYSGHGPYLDSAVSERYYDFVAGQLPEESNEMIIHSFAHAYETDLFIGRLYDRLEADGLLEDTVLVFYADHYDYYTQDDDAVMIRKGAADKNFLTRTPFMIYEKHTPAMKIDRAMCAIDILPTLVNLFGLDNDGAHYVGNDAFSSNGGYAIFSDYSWYDGETYWNALGDAEPTEEVLARNLELRERLEMSWDTMRLDYFGRKK